EALHVGRTVPEAALAALLRDRDASLEPEVLAARLQQLADETEVQNLQHAFGYYLDRKMWDDVADLFSAQGYFEALPQGAYVGRQHVQAALAGLYGAPPLNRGELFDHVLVGTVVTVSPDGTQAAARSTQLAMLGRGGEYARWELGVYENRFVKEDGRWKFAAVRYFPRMATDYDLGWAKDARPAPVRLAALPPDRPSERFEVYPAVQAVALHFVHPVTGHATRVPGSKVAPVETLRGGVSPANEATASEVAGLEGQLHAA